MPAAAAIVETRTCRGYGLAEAEMVLKMNERGGCGRGYGPDIIEFTSCRLLRRGLADGSLSSVLALIIIIMSDKSAVIIGGNGKVCVHINMHARTALRHRRSRASSRAGSSPRTP
jgi:hypothetical protein